MSHCPCKLGAIERKCVCNATLLGSISQRKLDPEGCAFAESRHDRRGAAVCRYQTRHDGQAQAAAALRDTAVDAASA